MVSSPSTRCLWPDLMRDHNTAEPDVPVPVPVPVPGSESVSGPGVQRPGFDELFKLQPTASPTRWVCEYPRLVLTPRNTLQGGAGLAAALLATEAVVGRPTVWATAQYLSFAEGTEPVELEVAVEVAGHMTTQARCVVTRHGVEILTAHIALGVRPFGPDRTWVTPPVVPPPLECPPFDYFVGGRGDLGDLTDIRLALGRQTRELRGSPGGSNSARWCRVTPARHVVGVGEIAFIGDLLPMSFCEPYGAEYHGSSIDNTVRFGCRAETEWVLLDCRLEQVANGFGHGHAYLWSEDGQLLGTASQTMVMRIANPAD